MSAIVTFCPTCDDESLISDRGLCVWCDTPLSAGDEQLRVIPRPAPEPRRFRKDGSPWRPAVGRGPVKVTMPVLREAYDLYLHGRDDQDKPLSLRKVAALLLHKTDYASEKSFANQMSDAFRDLGWPVRDRIAATVRASTTHGLLIGAKRPVARGGRSRAAYKYRRRRQLGLVRPPCSSLKVDGDPCTRPAMHGSDYCIAHDPARREQVLLDLEDARSRQRIKRERSAA